MKILAFANDDAGLLLIRRELLQAILDEGHELVVSVPDGPKVAALKALGCRVILTPMSRRGTNPIKDGRLLFQYIRLVKREKPNLILTFTIKPNIYGSMAARIFKVPYIPNITGIGTAMANAGPVQKIVFMLYTVALKKAKCVFFQNQVNMDLFLRKKLLKHPKCARLIPGSGVNLEKHSYEPYPDDEERTVFLFIGRIMRDKGVNELFDAAKSVKRDHPSAKFVLIGSQEEDYEAQIKELQSEGIVESLGFCENVHELIKKSHCVVLPSYHEGVANALLEAAACGRPVIATDVPGCRETFVDGVSGFSCEARNAKSLYQQLKRFLSLTKEEREQMGKAGRKKVEREFDRRIVIDAYMRQIATLQSGEEK